MIKKVSRNDVRKARHARVREKISGTASIPRLNVFRSNLNIFAQIIDDEKGITLVSASSIDKELKLENGGNAQAAVKVGELLAKRAKEAKISKVVFDRGGYLYHGRVKALAEAARENGLEF
ncbi:50S ribosomal protein L18 [bacterium]|nr:50S ribosomal protein L18 [bacterium]